MNKNNINLIKIFFFDNKVSSAICIKTTVNFCIVQICLIFGVLIIVGRSMGNLGIGRYPALDFYKLTKNRQHNRVTKVVLKIG